MNTFTFPKDTYNDIQDLENLIKMIEMENRLNGSRIRYRCYEIRKQYLYAKCSYKGCRAQLRFKRKDSDNGYLIHIDQRSHDHSQGKSALHQNI